MTREALRTAPLFAGLSDNDLERLSQTVERQRLSAGDYLLREGEQGDAMFVIVSGELEVTKRAEDVELPLARVGPGAIQGEIAAIGGQLRAASVRALTDVEVLRVPREGLLALLDAGPEPALALLRTVLERIRGLESFVRGREKLAGLGTLAAGLAHELNNPAAAIRRSVASLSDAIAHRDTLHPPHELIGVRPDASRAPQSPLARADAIDEMIELVDDSEIAAALVDAGWSVDQLHDAFGGMDEEAARASAEWLAATATVEALLREVGMAGDRISEIVGAVKTYVYLDQAPVQRVNVLAGLDNTLVILRSKLRAVEVTRHYEPDVPEIDAYGSELNQVWTNLIDNAVDAMDGRGAIDIYVRRTDQGGVEVKICDTGPGIPPDILPRLFEPFFTTKPVGVGTGLGLHITHSAVARAGGTVDVTPNPEGGTCFVITLPAKLASGPTQQPSEAGVDMGSATPPIAPGSAEAGG
ncbi:MAG TPA: ATP-binding protein [Candidatus Limnocylindrales bacterium]|nr:ATP-binding protein [Candidatus Limnocylindrales bacterium]